ADNGRIRLWRTSSRQRLASFDHGAEKAFGVAFANDDETLATSGIDPVVRLWTVSDQSLIMELEGHKDGSRGLDSSRDGKVIVSGSRDNTARVWDAATGEELVTMGHIDSALDLPIAIDTPPVFVSSQAPAPFDFKGNPEKTGLMLGKGVAAAFAFLLGALIIKGVFWFSGARAIARPVVVSVLFAVTAYLGLLIAATLPAEALALWLTIAFVPATVFALMRWIWRATVLRNVSRRTRKPS
ncbi:MAG: WD40 repeat domain-containing protein, partial [Hyphococcus sp.]